ncbi:hypothetical protein GCM10022268_32440 [Sphingomonas cynarae]|uniref:BLUF domain-containing protein n=1 Tax=Sphingomonas cynarae TaxID=930197 RepID=A0ABP7ENM8_9SPHN
MLQLVYISTTVDKPSTDDILRTSRRNNARDGLTGLLYSDGKQFMQALEGPADKVEAAYARIKADPRHRAAVILSRRDVETREFGQWEMAARAPGEESEAFLARVEQLIVNADRNVQATFEGFARINRAA